jgi:hypothetical protein
VSANSTAFSPPSAATNVRPSEAGTPSTSKKFVVDECRLHLHGRIAGERAGRRHPDAGDGRHRTLAALDLAEDLT